MRRYSPGLLGVLIVTMVLAILAVAWEIVSNDREHRRATDEANAVALQSAVETFTTPMTARMLDLATALNGLSTAERRQRFDRLARLIRRGRAVESVSFIQLVRDRSAYERARTAIHDVAGRSARDAARYFVVDQRVTKQKDRRRIGADLLSDPQRRTQIQRAVDSGRDVSTKPLRLLSGTVGTALFVPVFNSDSPPKTVQERRKDVVGLASTTMRLETIEQTVRRLVPQIDGFVISDGGRVIVKFGDTDNLGPARTVDENGRRWQVASAEAPSKAPLRVTAALGIGSGLITFVILTFAQTRRREEYANELVDLRTRELKTERHQLLVAQRLAQLGSFSCDLMNGEVKWSEEVFKLLGARKDSGPLPMSEWNQFIDAAQSDQMDERFARAIAEGGDFELEFTRRTADEDGREVILLTHGFVENDAAGRPARLVGTIVDISERRRREQHLRHQADHDPLTGLPNRRGFERALKAHLADRRRGGTGALLLLDLDGLKELNDSHGHAAGDALLRCAAERIAAAMRQEDMPARIGGDEFAVLLPDTAHDQAPAAAERLLERLREPSAQLREFGVDRVAASIGVATVRDMAEGGSPEDLMALADRAMYHAKESGGDQIAAHASTR